MKIAVATFVAVASAQDSKKVPPRHPLQRLNKLNKFAAEWAADNLDAKAAPHWTGKFERNVARFERRFELCGFYDENQLPHGGPSERRKREIDSDSIWDRYDREDPAMGTKQITTGFRKWAERYLSECSGQKNYNYHNF